MFLFSRKKIINNLSLKTRVLVSPLDWGLGHATRCIPIIFELLSNQCEVFIAAEGTASLLLKSEFPQLTILPLKGYRLTFSRNKSFLSWKIFIQLPKIMYTVYYEKQWLKKVIKKYKIEIIISDNRVGLYNKNITSVYITHQLSIKTGNKFTAAIATWIHHYFINQFNECWVPDFFGKENLAGELSHPSSVASNVKYIGAISRFEKQAKSGNKYDLLIILSGPEPQRTIFEKLLLLNLLNYSGKTLLIRGLPANNEELNSETTSVEIINHLPAKELCAAMQQAEIVICRSGYTTIMDLVKINKKAILVPTPGQAEQEYLAGYLKKINIFFSIDQQNFNVNDALEKFSQFKSVIPLFDMEQYKEVIKSLVQLESARPDFIPRA